LLPPAQPQATTAMAVSAMATRMQGNTRFKTFPLTSRGGLTSSNKAPIWRPQGKQYRQKTPADQPEMARGPAHYAEPLMV
jgi:hypothetical protein